MPGARVIAFSGQVAAQMLEMRRTWDPDGVPVNRALAEAIGAYLQQPLAKCQVRRFADMEIFVEIQENVRGEDVPRVMEAGDVLALQASEGSAWAW